MLHMPDLIDRINSHTAFVKWYVDNIDTPAGKAVYKVAYAMFAKISTDNGGGQEPYLFTAQKDTAKTDKNTSIVYEQIIRYLMAANRSGLINLCPHSTPECRAGCLGHTSGRLRFNDQQRAQYIRTKFLHDNTAFFLIVEINEVRRHVRRINKAGRAAVARFNGTSDISYELTPGYTELLAQVGLEVMFDYTADHYRDKGWVEHISPMPYHLTHSTKEGTHPNDIKAGTYTVVAIKKGDPIPDTYNGLPTFDGDLSDMRFLDPAGHATLGRAKGALKGRSGAADSFVKPASHEHTSRRLTLVTA